MNLIEIRKNLYRNYCLELSAYDPGIREIAENEDILDDTVASYICDSTWIDIFSGNGDFVGFAIFSTNEKECHPDADREICQVYVKKEYRRQGLASEVIIPYIQEHPGLYSLDILNGNTTASRFWNEIFASLGARYVELPEVRTDKEMLSYLTLYGYDVG